MKRSVFTLVLALGVTAVISADSKPDENGYLREWLVLAPIASGADGNAALDKEFVKDEAKLAPTEGEKVKVGDAEVAWKKLESKEPKIDFNAFVGKETPESTGYAVSYVTVEEEMKVKLKLGSDDQAKVYINGKEVVKVSAERPLNLDDDTAEVTLSKGVNTIVVKLVNVQVDWAFSLRFVDKDDKPVTGLKIALKK
jgi:hypothetical protein